MGGDYVGLHGDENLFKIIWGADVGFPTKGFVEWGAPHAIPTQSPRKVFRMGIAWGGFAWVSETGVSISLSVPETISSIRKSVQ